MSAQVKLNSTSGGSVTLDPGSTAGNYTLTLPNTASSTIADTSTAQTLSNKTLTSTPSVTFSDSSVQNTAATGFGFKNRIINGGMGIWQRGTSGFTTSGNYSADRWFVQTGTSLSAVGQSSDVPTGFKYSLSVAGTNQPSAVQRIESANCTDLVGQSVTVSLWIKQTVSAGSNAMYVWLGYANSADSFGSVTAISSTNITTTSSWAQYSVTFTNLPAGAANGLQIIIGCNGASTNTFLVTGVQLEKGSTATSFDYRPYGTELALCQRYCYNIKASDAGAYTRYAVGLAYSSTSANCVLNMPVTMRTQPSVTSTGTASSYAINNANDAFPACNALPSIQTNQSYGNIVTLYCQVASGLTAGSAALLTSNGNTTSYLLFTAEL